MTSNAVIFRYYCRRLMNNITARTSILTALTAFTLITLAFSQRPAGDRIERFRTMSKQAEEKSLAEDYKATPFDDKVRPGLFPVLAPDASTEPVRKAADA